jgi:hypothetical protein
MPSLTLLRAIASIGCAVLFIGTSAAGWSQRPRDDAVLAIDAGRLLAVLNQVARLLGLNDTSEPGSESVEAELSFAVSRYSQLRQLACTEGVASGLACNEEYSPRLAVRPSSTTLHKELDETEETIRAFWEEVCLRRDPGHIVCQLE